MCSAALQPSKEALRKLALALLPEIAELIHLLKEGDGHVRFPEKIRSAIERLKVSGYVSLYEGESRILFAYSKCLGMEKADLDELNALDLLPYEKQQAYLDDFIDDATSQEMQDAMDNAFDFDEESANQHFLDMTPEEKQISIAHAQRFLSFFLASFHNYLAVMVHGKKMTQLVPEAMQGNRESFLMAVHIDRSLLSNHPFFSSSRLRAAETGDLEFLRKIAYREQSPTMRGRIQYPTLWTLFSILDGLNALDGVFTHGEILDLCDEAQIHRTENRIEDVGYLTKRIRDFRRFQKTGGVSMH